MAKSYDEYRLGEPYERSRRKGLKVFVILASLMAITIVPALAARGGGGGGGGKGGHGGSGGGSTSGGGTLTLRVLTGPDSTPNWGEEITFTVSTTATTEPNVNVKCSQNGNVVYGAVTGYYDSYPWPWTQIMTLSSQSWTGGAADCTATLSAYSGTNVTTLGTLPFHVDA
jgi:hypothetical protein